MAKTDNPEDRYEEILRRITARKQEGLDPFRQLDLAAVLDGLNAMGFLDDVRRKRLPGLSIYGPKAVKGTMRAEAQNSQWAGGVVWYKPRGYHHYRTITLLGIWGVEVAASTTILVGEKTLEFDAPVFNPESYYRSIKDKFELYYGDDCSPPEGDRLCTLTYTPGERLAIRAALESVLSEWVKHLKSG
jgi:hypothetical protein